MHSIYKKLHLFCLVLLISLSCFAQQKEYLDSFFFQCRKDSAVFYRIAQYDSDSIYHGTVKTWYMSGKLYCEATYHHGYREGKWNYWFSNGQKYLESVCENDAETRMNSWTPDGKPMLVNGTGRDTSYYMLLNRPEQTGLYKHGCEEDTFYNWYRSGKPKSIWVCANDEELYIKTVLDEDGNYMVKNGNGHMVVWYKPGCLRYEGDYKDGKRANHWIWYYRNGRKSHDCYYNKNELDGTYTTWYMNGRKKFECSYLKGEREGKLMIWYWNGQKYEEGTYTEGSYKLEGYWREDGTQTITDGNGVMESFYYNGNQLAVGKYLNGYRTGRWVWYYENGRTREEGEYDSDMNYKTLDFYDSDGNQLIKEGTGLYKFIRPVTGTIEVEGNLKDSKREGAWIWYYENGNLEEIGIYERATIVDSNVSYFVNGVVKFRNKVNGHIAKKAWFYEDGKLKETATYKNNQLADSLISYSPNQTITFIGFYDGESSIRTWFYDDGKIKIRCRYLGDLLHGKCIWYHPNGEVRDEVIYKLGKKHGVHIVKNEEGKIITKYYYNNGELVKRKNY